MTTPSDPSGAGLPARWRASAASVEDAAVVRTEHQLRQNAADIHARVLDGGGTRRNAVQVVAEEMRVSPLRACRLVADLGPDWVVDQLLVSRIAATPNLLEAWERGATVPSPAALQALAALYEVRIEDLGFHRT